MNKDDKEKEPIKIDIENLEDLSEEEIINLINELTSKEVENKKKPNTFKDKIKYLSLEFIKKLAEWRVLRKPKKLSLIKYII